MTDAHVTITKTGIKRTCRKCRYLRHKSYITPKLKPIILISALLITTWPDGTIQRTATVDKEICRIAANYDLAHGAIDARCITNLDPLSAGFKPGWHCIQNYNCP